MNHGVPLLVLTLLTSTLAQKPSINATVVELPIEMNRNYTFNSGTEYIISICGLPSDLSKVPPQIYAECFQCNSVNPAIIIVRQRGGVMSFQLPMVSKLSDGHEVEYYITERTLCPYNEREWKMEQCDSTLPDVSTVEENTTLIVSLATSSKENITLSLGVWLVSDFLLEVDTNKTVTLTPSSSHFYLYEFSNDTEEAAVVLEVESEFDNCMILSIQNKSCPIVDTGYVYYSGYFQTVIHLGGMTVRRDMFPMGFYAVFTLEADDRACLSPSGVSAGQRFKTVTISVKKSIYTEHYVYIVVGTICAILVVYAMIICLTFLCFMRKDIEVPELENVILESHEASTSAHFQQPSTLNDSDIPGTLKVSSPAAEDTLSIKTDSSLDEIDIDTLMDAEFDKNIFRTKTTLYLSDLAKKNPTVLKKKSELYFWNLMTVAIFYGLPAGQLVITYQYELHQSGNEDLCYYNYLCSHPLLNFFDFNHIFSNIGYVALGFLFLIITNRKDQVQRALYLQDDRLERQYGVPQHCGLYYAMGSSLIIEGLLSGFYHVCPNMYNFQFDASFMYVISTLCMIKIYQSRHPDVNATAYSTFFLIAFVLSLGICGTFTPFSPFFWALLTTVHFGTVLYISFHIYYVGRFSFNFRSVIRYLKEFSFGSCGTRQFWRPTYPNRFALISTINLCNWGLAAAALVLGVKDISSYILLIFIVNLLLYTTFYIIMKILCGEKILPQPLVYIFLAVVSWSAALYYFFHKTISWKKTPAESRAFNRPCVLFDFYDNHDIWHFISSGGLFFSFLVLLTLDDDLIFVHRSRIPVF